MSDDKKPFSVKARLQSFKYAFNGLKILLGAEHNARIHLVVAVIACLMGWFLDISAMEWLVILILIGLVIAMEIVNSCIEYICNFISPAIDDRIKIIKDLASAAVLIVAIIAVICGFIIFLPKLLLLI
ncbi:diacylglycerol kinase family protein [Dysgonomonas sp. 25]|uniref:diacylglycerol kinase family protein n=1 Tax=Dysgonomonas sp. 25 TaxID=2302933 RepID=UPI0013D26A2C|nr:diacylglycerol kinase family protein [Dysgonomonas sp. 25]NDV70351.1 diacylglycerol kinase family protein [Dysgonomonas sp. 25]